MKRKSEESLFPTDETVEFYKELLNAIDSKRPIRENTIENAKMALDLMCDNSKGEWVTRQVLLITRTYSKKLQKVANVDVLVEYNVSELILNCAILLGYFEKKKIHNINHYRSTQESLEKTDVLKVATLKNIMHNVDKYDKEMKDFIASRNNKEVKATDTTESVVDNRHQIVVEKYNEASSEANTGIEKLNNLINSSRTDSLIDNVAYVQQNREFFDRLINTVEFVQENREEFVITIVLFEKLAELFGDEHTKSLINALHKKIMESAKK